MKPMKLHLLVRPTQERESLAHQLEMLILKQFSASLDHSFRSSLYGTASVSGRAERGAKRAARILTHQQITKQDFANQGFTQFKLLYPKLFVFLLLGRCAYSGTVNCSGSSGDTRAIKSAVSAGESVTISGSCSVTSPIHVNKPATISGNATLNANRVRCETIGLRAPAAEVEGVIGGTRRITSPMWALVIPRGGIGASKTRLYLSTRRTRLIPLAQTSIG
jgi:hypothetical protein